MRSAKAFCKEQVELRALVRAQEVGTNRSFRNEMPDVANSSRIAAQTLASKSPQKGRHSDMNIGQPMVVHTEFAEANCFKQTQGIA